MKYKTPLLNKYLLFLALLLPLLALINFAAPTHASSQSETLASAGTFNCYYAQLQAKSSYSTGSLKPQQAYLDAQSAGLNAFSLMDDVTYLRGAAWSKLQSCSLDYTIPLQYIALSAFEWPYTFDEIGSYGETYGQGHLGVINSLDTYSVPEYKRVRSAPNPAEGRADLKAFYEWVAQATSFDGSEVIAQFNHPSSGLYLWRFNDFEPPWWIDPSLRSEVVDRVALFEMGSGISPYHGPTWHPGNGLTNEMLFKQALNNGWRLAPVMNEDNATSTMVATSLRTGLWAAELTLPGVMEALHSRRVFASEDANFQLAFFADNEWMGSVLSRPDATSVTFHIDWQDSDDPIANIWLVANPGDELPLSLAGKNLLADSLEFSITVNWGDWYYVKILQSDGNLIYSAPIWIAPPPLVANAGPDKSTTVDNSVTLEGAAAGGTSPYTYSWAPATGLNDPSIPQPTASTDATTTYTLTVTDALGRTASDAMTVFATAHTLSIAASAVPETIESGGTVQLNATVLDSVTSHNIATWSWHDNGAAGTFLPSANVQAPTWTAPGNTTGTPISRTLSLTASCDASTPASSTTAVSISEQSAAFVLTLTASPAEGGATSGAGTYNATTVVPITATPNAGWQFDYWTGPVADPNAASTTVLMDADKSATAHFSIITHTLTVLPDPAEGGSVSGAGTYPEGTVVNISAAPNAGWLFDHWSGPVADANAASTTVTMDSDKSVTAIFARIQHTLTAVADPPEGGSVTGAGTYNYGDTATVTAAPNTGWSFSHWTGPVADINSPSTTVLMDADKAIIAHFTVITFDLTTLADPATGGAVTGAGTYNYGDTATVTATPNTGWSFTHWTGPVADANAATTTVLMDADKAVTAHFATVTYTLNVLADPSSGGSVTGAGVYPEGAVANVSATPNSGWLFSHWTGPVADANAASSTVTMDADKSVTASFNRIQYTLTAAIDPPEGGSVSGAGTYNSGETASLTATANTGWQFDSWSGPVADANSPSTTILMDGNKSVTAHFSPITYSLTVLADPAEGGAVTGAGTYNFGATASVSAVPNSGWLFDHWEGAVADPDSATTTVTMDADKSVTAFFTRIQHILAVSADPIEGGTVTGSGIYPQGSVANISATPNAGWLFDHWTGPVADPSSAATTVTMDTDKSVAATFTRIQYTLTTAVDPPEGGSVTGAGTYNSGETASVTAIPGTDWDFDYWSGPVADVNAASTTVFMDSDQDITAHFIEAALPSAIELSLLQIADSADTPQTEFRPGETARITLRATNTGGAAQVWVTLAADSDTTAPFDYDSTASAQDQSATLGQNESLDFTFEWSLPEDAATGSYDLLGTVRDFGDFATIYDDTEPGASTTSLGASAWLDDALSIIPFAASYELYRGQFHTHSNYSAGKKDPATIYRDSFSGGLDLTALQDSENELYQSEWTNMVAAAQQETYDNNFVALPGFEWKYTFDPDGTYGGTYGQGHAGVINSTEFVTAPGYDALGRPPSDEEATTDLKAFYEWIATALPVESTGLVAQFNHPSGGLYVRRFNNFEAPWWVDPSLRSTVVQRIALFEMGTGIKTYYGPTWDPGNGLTNEIHFKAALNNGWKLAPTVSEDNKTYTTPATPRRTGIWASELTRAGVMDALLARRTYGSDDINFSLAFFADGAWMGSTIPLPADSTVEFRIEWNDPDDQISNIWLVRQPGDEIALDLTGKNLFSDFLVVSQPALAGEWYFVKVAQADGDLIFSAPVWIAPLPMQVDAGVDVTIDQGQSIALNAAITNGRAPYTYSWAPADSLDDPAAAQPLASPTVTTTYTLTITDAVGESAGDTVTVFVNSP